MLEKLRKYPTQTNAGLSFVVGMLSAIGVNKLTATPPALSGWIFVAAAVLLLAGQTIIVYRFISTPSKPQLKDLLKLGTVAFIEHSHLGKEISFEDIRGSFHEVRKSRPHGDRHSRPCLYLVARHRVHEYPDTDLIELDDYENRRWYFNVKSANAKCGHAGDVNPDRPVKSQDTANIKGIISYPIIDGGNVLGTVTYDSAHHAKDMRWIDEGGNIEQGADKIMRSIVDVVRREIQCKWDD